jgi:hypothetical protein
MEQKILPITSLESLQEYARGAVVQLPSFSEDQPFVARLRRPSMMALAKSGKIPNSLLNTANSLFMGEGMDSNNERALKEVLSIVDILCEAAFVEPTYSQLKEARVELTDEQYMAVFNYTQQGVKALEPFRGKS